MCWENENICHFRIGLAAHFNSTRCCGLPKTLQIYAPYKSRNLRAKPLSVFKKRLNLLKFGRAMIENASAELKLSTKAEDILKDVTKFYETFKKRLLIVSICLKFLIWKSR